MGWMAGLPFPAGQNSTLQPIFRANQISCPVNIRVLSSGVKWPGCEAYYSIPNAKVKNALGCIFTSPHICVV